MSPDDGLVRFVKAALDEIGVTLWDDAEYVEVHLSQAPYHAGVGELARATAHDWASVLEAGIRAAWNEPGGG